MFMGLRFKNSSKLQRSAMCSCLGRHIALLRSWQQFLVSQARNISPLCGCATKGPSTSRQACALVLVLAGAFSQVARAQDREKDVSLQTMIERLQAVEQTI